MPARVLLSSAAALVLAAGASPARAQSPATEITVSGDREAVAGTADAASQGQVGARRIEARAASRPAAVLELVPGLVVAQHSGEGKANQYFLRGFNLDHGTDFATRVDGVPVNLPTHAHGHGYTDLGFLIPELVGRIDYRKGPYFAAEGDFSSAGSADLALRDALPAGLAQLTLGSHGYGRLLVAGSPLLDNGARLLAAFEATGYDGPWDSPQRLRKLNGLLRYTDRVAAGDLAATLSIYENRWNATDQIPLRAIQSGAIGRFGAVDPTDGGETSRTALSARWRRPLRDGSVEVQAYALRYRLDLFSNFTYFLDRPAQGDQFEQRDARDVYGGTARRLWAGSLAGRPMTNEVGLQLRHDRIDVGLFDSVARVRTDTVRDDRVRQTSLGLYGENGIAWTDWLRTVAGLRVDRYRFDVASSLPANGGRETDLLASPKLSAILGPRAGAELFLNWGRGFHSNDARGTVARIDPRSGDAVQPVPALVRTTGREIGIRAEPVRGLRTSLALWRLDIGSELVFAGDAGTTEPSRPSRRQGLEWANRWAPAPWLLLDLDLGLARARFVDGDPAGDRVPGSVTRVAAAAVTVRDLGPWWGSLQLRHLGRRPLVEDGSVSAAASTLVNLRLGWRVSPTVELLLDALNLLDRRDNDIEYFYVSRLPGEPAAGVADRHLHPVEPRSLRATVRVSI